MPPLAWRQVRPPTCTVAGALGRSVDLLTRGECPALVVHSVSPAAITVGRAQMADVDVASAAREGLEVIARPSGGGPVLWDDDLIAISGGEIGKVLAVTVATATASVVAGAVAGTAMLAR